MPPTRAFAPHRAEVPTRFPSRGTTKPRHRHRRTRPRAPRRRIPLGKLRLERTAAALDPARRCLAAITAGIAPPGSTARSPSRRVLDDVPARPPARDKQLCAADLSSAPAASASWCSPASRSTAPTTCLVRAAHEEAARSSPSPSARTWPRSASRCASPESYRWHHILRRSRRGTRSAPRRGARWMDARADFTCRCNRTSCVSRRAWLVTRVAPPAGRVKSGNSAAAAVSAHRRER